MWHGERNQNMCSQTYHKPQIKTNNDKKKYISLNEIEISFCLKKHANFGFRTCLTKHFILFVPSLAMQMIIAYPQHRSRSTWATLHCCSRPQRSSS